MRFAEAEQVYRELEGKLIRGEVGEDDFLVQVAQLRLVDEEGRRWMLSARSGRWLVHDGQQWVFAQPPREQEEIEARAMAAELAPDVEEDITASAPPASQRTSTRGAGDRRALTPRLLAIGVLAVLVVGCLVGGGISAWVFLIRDLGQTTPESTGASMVTLVETYTPRPATPTYTPTFTSTPSRTPTPTITPTASRTPFPTSTATPAPTFTATRPLPTRSPTSTPSPLPSATSQPTSTTTPSSLQTYTVRKGDTLSEIAARFGVSVAALANANGITDPQLVRVGQVLIIPVPGLTITPTWTPIVLTPRTPTSTPRVTPRTPTPTRTSRPTATRTPKPTATRTPQPPALTGKIAFTMWNPYTHRYDLYSSLINGSGRTLLGEGLRQPQYRQDGNLLAANGDGKPNYEHLVIMEPDGGSLKEVSNYSQDSYPSWSPDGAILAFSSAAWGDGRILLGIVHDMYGKNQHWIPYGSTEVQGVYPFWLPDGRIVYHGCSFWTGGGACGLYIVDSDGSNPQILTSSESDTAPAAYNAKVAFMSARDGNWEVYSINVDGSGLKRLTTNAAQDGLPTWSPDGQSIAFVSTRGGVWAIWAMNANGSNQRKLFNLEGEYGSGEYGWTTERISWAP